MRSEVRSRIGEHTVRWIMGACAGVSLLALGLIVLFLFREGMPVFRTVSLGGFLGGRF